MRYAFRNLENPPTVTTPEVLAEDARTSEHRAYRNAEIAAGRPDPGPAGPPLDDEEV